MAVRTLAELIAEIRQRSDHQNSDFVTDTELEVWLNQSAKDLYDLVLDHAGHDAYLTQHTTTTAAGVSSIVVSAYRILGVDVRFAGRWRSIDRIGFADRNRYEGVPGWTGPHDTKYMLAGRTVTGVVDLMFIPEPTGVFDVRVWHLPNASLVAGGGADLIAFNGWDEYVISDVAAKILEKKEADSRPFLRRKEEARERIIVAAAQLDGGLHTMRDVAAVDYDEEAAFRSS